MVEMGVGIVEEKWKDQLQVNFSHGSYKDHSRLMRFRFSSLRNSASTIPGKDDLE